MNKQQYDISKADTYEAKQVLMFTNNEMIYILIGEMFIAFKLKLTTEFALDNLSLMLLC